MFYTLNEVIDDLKSFEKVNDLNFPANVLEAYSQVEFSILYSEFYKKSLSDDGVVNDLKRRVRDYFLNVNIALPKKRDRDPDPDAAYTIYKYWDAESFYKIELEYFDIANTDDELLKFFKSDQGGMSLAVYDNSTKLTSYYCTSRH